MPGCAWAATEWHRLPNSDTISIRGELPVVVLCLVLSLRPWRVHKRADARRGGRAVVERNVAAREDELTWQAPRAQSGAAPRCIKLDSVACRRMVARVDYCISGLQCVGRCIRSHLGRLPTKQQQPTATSIFRRGYSPKPIQQRSSRTTGITQAHIAAITSKAQGPPRYYPHHHNHLQGWPPLR